MDSKNNTGHWNTGHWNTGNRNTGDYNTGDWNTGDYNTGNRNTGNWNTTNNDTGYFNTVQSDTVRVFNKECSREDWNCLDKPNFIYDLTLARWINEPYMSENEKQDNPEYKTTGGYLKTWTYKEAWKNAWDNREDNDLERLLALPNFDADVFLEISGIDVRKDAEVEEMTMEEVCEALGKNIKIKK